LELKTNIWNWNWFVII